MKNVRQNQLKKAICLSQEEFDYIVRYIFGENYHVSYDDGEIYIDLEDIDEESIDNQTLIKHLSHYFDVDVTSVHIDNCDVIGVWVIYKDIEEGK